MRAFFSGPRWGEIWRIGLAFLIGAVYTVSVLVAVALAEDGSPEGYSPYTNDVMFVVDPAVGLLALGLIPFRRRRPFWIAIAALTLSAVSPAAIGTVIITLGSLATTRHWRRILVAGVYGVALGLLAPRLLVALGLLSIEAQPDWIAGGITHVFLLAAISGIGVAIGAQRASVAALHDQIASADREAARRSEQARATERARIAREMHDVLAHRISLIAMHAGALSYREDLPREQVREIAGLLRDNADQAILELRAVLGVLRGTEEPSQPRTPQPDLSGLQALAEELRAGGTEVALDVAETGAPPVARGHLDVDAVPSAISRAAYRIVQEGLTNARKHAPGMPVGVHVRGTPSGGLDIQVVNAAAPYRADAPAAPSSGMGLLGLTERAQLSGGRLSHGVDRSGRFLLRAWLPWESAATTRRTPEDATDPQIVRTTSEKGSP